MAKEIQLSDGSGYVYPIISPREFKYRGNNFTGDLNTLTGLDKMGIYALGGSATNKPNDSGSNWGILINAVPTYGSQMIFNSNGIWTRSYTGNPLAWTAWKKATMTVV